MAQIAAAQNAATDAEGHELFAQGDTVEPRDLNARAEIKAQARRQHGYSGEVMNLKVVGVRPQAYRGGPVASYHPQMVELALPDPEKKVWTLARPRPRTIWVSGLNLVHN